MFVPLSYNVRSVTQRWRNTGATVLAIGLAVAVVIVMFAMQGGIERSLQGTGTPGNAIVMRSGSTAELNSIVTQSDARLLAFLPGVARDEDGVPLISTEYVTTQSIPRSEGEQGVNVSLRGVPPLARLLRPEMRLVEGEWFRPGKKEIVFSRKLADRFGRTVGDTIKLGLGTYTVSGLFDAGQSAYNSEIWGDVDELRRDFNFDFYSVAMVRLEADFAGPIPEARARAGQVAAATAEAPAADGAPAKEPPPEERPFPGAHARAAEALRAALKADQRFSHDVRSEVAYYESQTVTAAPLKILGTLLMILMGPAAAFGAMNAMYAAIARRVREIGTLRVLGFRRPAVLLSFLLESVVLAGLGGAFGCALSYGLMKLALGANFANFGTMNFVSFSEIVFQFSIEPGYLAGGFLFALVIGVVGGLLPATAASRLPILSALKA